MTWPLLENDEYDAVADMECNQSDRATAIVCAALLEDRLSTAIRMKCVQDKKVIDQFFRSAGPLGSFSAKSDLGYLLGLFSKEVYTDLYYVRQIRNEFAHKMKTRSFATQRIADLCRNFKSHKRNFTVEVVDKKIGIKPQRLFPELDVDSPTYNRDQFVRVCQVLVVMFGIFEPKGKPRQPKF